MYRLPAVFAIISFGRTSPTRRSKPILYTLHEYSGMGRAISDHWAPLNDWQVID